MSDQPIKTVCVLGLGYIGLPTASIIASRGIEVIGVDTQQAVVNKINQGEIHIVEPDLEAVTSHAVHQGFLRASISPSRADAFLIAVPTPFHDEKADLSYVEAAARSIAPFLEKGNLVVLESTSPPGTTQHLISIIAEMRPDLVLPNLGGDIGDIYVAYCPERVLPGRVLIELLQNDRVIGGITNSCSKRAAELYRIFCEGDCLMSDARTAEMCKLSENAFRDVNIAFANELSLICEKLEINVWTMIELANRHPRVNILKPGPGVGGHCIAVDPLFIVAAAPDEAPLIRTAREVNDGKPRWVLSKVKEAIDSLLDENINPTITLLGLTFKPDVDDLRESPALKIAEGVISLDDSLPVIIVEPYIQHLPAGLGNHRNVTLETNLKSAIEAAHIVVVLVDHRAFSNVQQQQFTNKHVIDTTGAWRDLIEK